MKTEKACGAIITRHHQGTTEVLLVHQSNGFTAFPKGHVEPGESERDTAKREVLEETSLHVHIPADSPRFEFSYTIPQGTIMRPGGTPLTKPIHKIVVLFLATLTDATTASTDANPADSSTINPALDPTDGTPQPGEIDHLLWVPLPEVANHLAYPAWRRVWQAAVTAIRK